MTLAKRRFRAMLGPAPRARLVASTAVWDGLQRSGAESPRLRVGRRRMTAVPLRELTLSTGSRHRPSRFGCVKAVTRSAAWWRAVPDPQPKSA